MGKMNVLSGSGRVVLPGGDWSDEGERSWVGDKIKVPTHSELRKSFILTAVILVCDVLLSPIGISKLLEFLLLFKDGSWFVEMTTVGDGRTELVAWVEDTVKVEGLMTSTECAVEDKGGRCGGGEGLTATSF